MTEQGLLVSYRPLLVWHLRHRCQSRLNNTGRHIEVPILGTGNHRSTLGDFQWVIWDLTGLTLLGGHEHFSCKATTRPSDPGNAQLPTILDGRLSGGTRIKGHSADGALCGEVAKDGASAAHSYIGTL